MKNMTSYWNTFFTSGKVEDYLAFKQEEAKEEQPKKQKEDLSDELRFQKMKQMGLSDERLY